MTTASASPPRLVIDVQDERLGPLGYVVIDRPVHAAASGGVRFAPDVSVDELSGLARAMTYKWAFLNVAMGGAKAGIFADPQQLGCERQTLMESFGRSIAALVRGGVYSPGIDLGTTLDDLRAIMRGAGRPLTEPQIDGSLCTALTVFEAIRQVTLFRGLALSQLRVAVEGFGKVAASVVQMLAQAGATIVVVSTVEGTLAAADGLDAPQLVSLKQQHGDRLVHFYPGLEPLPCEALFSQPVDLLVPGARPNAIHAGNVGQVQARLIVPIANVPATPEAEQALIARGVEVMPDFVANCGGILASDMLGNHFGLEDVRRVVERSLAEVVAGLLRRADREGRPVGEVARELAWQNHLALNAAAPGSPRLLDRLAHALKAEGAGGVWRRLAWRAHRRWPSLDGKMRRMAADRFAEMRLGVTLARLTARDSRQPLL